MLDLPLNKALVAVEKEEKYCDGCYFYMRGEGHSRCGCYRHLVCNEDKREDGKNVIFKLVDYYPDEGWDLR